MQFDLIHFKCGHEFFSNLCLEIHFNFGKRDYSNSNDFLYAIKNFIGKLTPSLYSENKGVDKTR